MTKLPVFVLTVCLAAVPAFCAAPSIAAQGVKNAASYADPQLPNGSIAQGSIFNVFGSNMGPAALANAPSLPLPTTLSGTTVTVTITGSVNQCFMVYTSAGQVAAILPSTTPVGTGTITVSYNGTPSPTAPITVVKTSFGIFAINQQGTGQAVIQDGNYNFNSSTFAFQPNETVVLWGTGLGAINGSDATTPPTGNLPGITVTVTVGGLNAPVTYAGRSGYAGDDQVAFTIPAGVTGCFVPLYVSASAGGATAVSSSFTTIAVGTAKTCTDPNFPASFIQTVNSGGTIRTGSVSLSRSASSTSFAGFTINSNTDSGSGSFNQTTSSAYAGSGYLFDQQVGSCYVFTANYSATGTSTTTGLDAGSVINISGPSGPMKITPVAGQKGSYSATLGGGTTFPGAPPPTPLYLSPGTYALDNGAGGADVGAFKINIIVPAVFTWTNMSQITAVPRSQPLTLTWTGGDPNGQVQITGFSVAADNAEAAFVCHAPDSAGTFTVPAAILEMLPASTVVQGTAEGFLVLSTGNMTNGSVPSGLDLFSFGDSQGASISVPYQ